MLDSLQMKSQYTHQSLICVEGLETNSIFLYCSAELLKPQLCFLHGRWKRHEQMQTYEEEMLGSFILHVSFFSGQTDTVPNCRGQCIKNSHLQHGSPFSLSICVLRKCPRLYFHSGQTSRSVL